MKKTIGAILALIILNGCYCRGCRGEDLKKPADLIVVESATVTVSSTDVIKWKQTVYKGLNTLTRDPFNAICDLFLIHAFGMRSDPKGGPSIISVEGKARMDRIAESINASLGFALVMQYQPPEQNREAIQAAIESATDTIRDEKQREAFLQKAKLLGGGQ